MNLDWKKILLIFLFVATIILFSSFLYFVFFKAIFNPEPEEPPVTNTNATNVDARLPTIINAGGRIIAIDQDGNIQTDVSQDDLYQGSPSPVADGGLTTVDSLVEANALFTTIGPNGQIIYYDPTTGKFYFVSASGKITELSDKEFFNVSNVVWSNNTDTVLLEYPDSRKIIYNFQTDDQYTIPSHWDDFNFSPTDQQIAFKSIGLDVENRYLTVANVDGSGAKTLEKLGNKADQFQLNWSPNNQMVATFHESKDLNRSKVYFIGLNDENFRLMVVEGRGFQGIWSTAGDKILYSVYSGDNDYKPQLWISDATANTIGDNRRSIGIETWANKCYFANNTLIYCAVPKDMPYGGGVDETLQNTTIDDIYEINLATGAKSLVAIPNGEYNIDRIFIDGNYLFFSDTQNHGVYKIDLK